MTWRRLLHFASDGMGVRQHMEKALGVKRMPPVKPLVTRERIYPLRPRCANLKQWNDEHGRRRRA